MKIDANIIAMLRASRCMTLGELAKAANLTSVTIRRGYKHDIDPVSVGKIAHALNVDVKDIILQEVPEGNAQVAKIEKEAEHAEDTYNQCRVR